MGIVMQRRKKRAARLRASLLMAAVAASMLILLACSPQVHAGISGIAGSIQAFAQSTQLEMTLPEYDVYALQLAVFDNGDRAAAEAARLQKEGVRCVVWQRERMRIVVSAAYSREALDQSAAKGYEAYVIQDKLPAVSLRLSARTDDAEKAKRLLETPDTALETLLEGRQALKEIMAEVHMLAKAELDAHPENELYAQLAQSLMAWSAMMEKTLDETGKAEARTYGIVTMCTLCRQLRQALSEASTASAQRTPSTAAEVMPPA